MEKNLKPFFVLLIVGIGILLVESFLLDIYYEEPTRLLVAVSMFRESSWITPHILGEVYLKKPPGFNWMVALFSAPFGAVNKVSGRLVSIFSLLLLALMTWKLTRNLKQKARLLAVSSILFSVVLYVEKAALAEIDLFFTAVLFAGFFLFYYGKTLGNILTSSILSQLVFGFALLTKGPVAYLFFYPTIAIYSYLDENKIKWKYWIFGAVFTHAIAFSWLYFFVETVGYDRFLGMIYSELFSRGGGSLSSYVYQLFNYPTMVILSFAPWSFFMIYGLFDDSIRRDFLDRLKNEPTGRVVLAGVCPFLVLYFFPVDRVRYALPIFPFLALGVALLGEVALEKSEELFESIFRGICYLLSGILVPLVALPWGLDGKESLLSFNQILTGSVILSVTGLIFLVFSRTVDYPLGQINLVIAFMVVLKLGYLFVFLPVEEPQRFESESVIQEFSQKLSISRDSNIAYTSDSNLEIPYYFLKQNYDVRKVTDPVRTGYYRYLITKDRSFKGEILGSVKLMNAPKYYVISQEKSDGKMVEL